MSVSSTGTADHRRWHQYEAKFSDAINRQPQIVASQRRNECKLHQLRWLKRDRRRTDPSLRTECFDADERH